MEGRAAADCAAQLTPQCSSVLTLRRPALQSSGHTGYQKPELETKVREDYAMFTSAFTLNTLLRDYALERVVEMAIFQRDRSIYSGQGDNRSLIFPAKQHRTGMTIYGAVACSLTSIDRKFYCAFSVIVKLRVVFTKVRFRLKRLLGYTGNYAAICSQLGGRGYPGRE